MDRRKALAVAGSVTGILFAGTLAAAANFGLLGFGEHGGAEVGKLNATNIADIEDSPTTTTVPDVEVVYEDVVVPAPAAAAPAPSAADDEQDDVADDPEESPATTVAPTATVADHSDSDDSVDSADHAEEDHTETHDAVEHEGAGDDD